MVKTNSSSARSHAGCQAPWFRCPRSAFPSAYLSTVREDQSRPSVRCAVAARRRGSCSMSPRSTAPPPLYCKSGAAGAAASAVLPVRALYNGRGLSSKRPIAAVRVQAHRLSTVRWARRVSALAEPRRHGSCLARILKSVSTAPRGFGRSCATGTVAGSATLFQVNI